MLWPTSWPCKDYNPMPLASSIQTVPQSPLKTLERLLRIFTMCLFAGRAWQYLRWDTPWQNVLDLSLAANIQIATGILFIVCLLIAAGMDSHLGKLVSIIFLLAGSMMLLLQTIFSSMLQNWNVAQLIEHTIQWSLPLMLAAIISRQTISHRLLQGMKWAIALTFTGHGLFAAGIFPVPAHFVFMTQSVLGISADAARSFLLIAGILDFTVAIGLFINRIDRIVVVYAIIWGTLTALARIVAYYDPALPAESLDRWLYETVYRLGHGGLPLVIWINTKKYLLPKAINF